MPRTNHTLRFTDPNDAEGRAKTGCGIWRIDDPIATDNDIFRGIPKNATLTYASYIADDAGASTATVTFNIEIRGNATPFTAGTDVWAADKVCNTTSANTSKFDNDGTITARQILWVTISAVANTPTTFCLYLEWEIN